MDLVTGGTGIVGVHVINELLSLGRPVRALCRPGSDKRIVERVLCHYHADGVERYGRIQWVEGDLLDVASLEEAMSGVERVFHCAALVSFDPRDAKAMFEHNIQGTGNLLNAMIEGGVRILGHVSSVATVGAKPDGSANNEDVPFVSDRHASPYAVSKYEAELEVQRGIAEGLHAVMVNPCVVVGPGPSGRSSMTIVDRMRHGSAFYPPGTNAVVDARDVAACLVRLVDRGENGGRYLLIGENLSYKRFFTLIAEAFGKPAPSYRLRKWMLGLAWRAERLRTLIGGRPMITRISAGTASRTRNYDGSRVRTLLGHTFHTAEEAVENVAMFLRRSQDRA